MPSLTQVCQFLLLALPALSSPIGDRSEFNLVKKAGCNRDNLLRCLDPTAAAAAPTAASATAFCSSFLSIPVITSTISTTTSTTTTITATDYLTTTLPLVVKRAANTNLLACAATYAPPQLSSACSCLSITPSTTYVTATSTDIIISTVSATAIATITLAARCTPGVNLVSNPGFESGFDSWSESVYGANNQPTSWGVVSGGDNSGSSYSVSAGSGGTGTILSQSISGLVPGVTYTFSYDYLYENPNVASSISCSLETLSSESITNGDPLNTWLSGPQGYGSSFTAAGTSGTLQCYFIAGGTITWKIDNFYIGC